MEHPCEEWCVLYRLVKGQPVPKTELSQPMCGRDSCHGCPIDGPICERSEV